MHTSKKRREPSRRVAPPIRSGSTSTVSRQEWTVLRTRKRKTPEDGVPLQPTEHDILFGRGKAAINHPGNKFLHEVIVNKLPNYRDSTRATRKKIVRFVVHRMSEIGDFFKYSSEERRWTVVSENVAIEKVDQAFRYRMRQPNPDNMPHREVSPDDKVILSIAHSAHELSPEFELDFPEPLEVLAATMIDSPTSQSSPLDSSKMKRLT